MNTATFDKASHLESLFGLPNHDYSPCRLLELLVQSPDLNLDYFRLRTCIWIFFLRASY